MEVTWIKQKFRRLSSSEGNAVVCSEKKKTELSARTEVKNKAQSLNEEGD